MMSRFAQAAKSASEAELSVSESSDIDDPFESHATPKGASKPATAAAAAAVPALGRPASSSANISSLLSGVVQKAQSGTTAGVLSDSDAYSEDEFAQEKSPKVKAIAPASSSSKSSIGNAFGAAAKAATANNSSSKPSSKPTATRGRSRDRDSSRSRSPSRSASPFSTHASPKARAPRPRSRSGSRSPAADSKPSGGMSRLKSLLTKKRDVSDEKENSGKPTASRGKSFMDLQQEKLEANPHYRKKQKEIALKKMAAAGFMASAKTTDFSKQVSGLLSDLQNCSFKPVLSKGTRELLEKGGSQPEFSERLKMYISAKQDKLKAGAKLNEGTFTFQPKLNHDGDSEEEAKDAEAKRREFQERTAQDLKRRKEELAAKQRALESECTFAPKLSVLPKKARRSDKLSKSFLKRYEQDLDKRDAGIEAKLAAARLASHPYAPQINPQIAVKGSFLERTVKDVELRNKKMRYRAKLMDLTPPVHGRISIPPPEEDPFFISEQARIKRERAAAAAAQAEVKALEKELARSQSARGGLNATGAFQVHSATGTVSSPSKGWASLSGVLKSSASLGRLRPASAVERSAPVATIGRAPARPSDQAPSPPRRGARMSQEELAEYKRLIRQRKRAEEAKRAASATRGDGAEGSAHSSLDQSRRSSLAPHSDRKASKNREGKPAQHRRSTRSRSRSGSRSRSHSRSPSPFDSDRPSRRNPRDSRRTRSTSPKRSARRSHSRSRSASPAALSPGSTRSSSPFASRKKAPPKHGARASPRRSSDRHARQRSRSSSRSRSRSPSSLRSRSSSRSRSPPASKGRRR